MSIGFKDILKEASTVDEFKEKLFETINKKGYLGMDGTQAILTLLLLHVPVIDILEVLVERYQDVSKAYYILVEDGPWPKKYNNLIKHGFEPKSVINNNTPGKNNLIDKIEQLHKAGDISEMLFLTCIVKLGEDVEKYRHHFYSIPLLHIINHLKFSS